MKIHFTYFFVGKFYPQSRENYYFKKRCQTVHMTEDIDKSDKQKNILKIIQTNFETEKRTVKK